jgi:hypothetical protein
MLTPMSIAIGAFYQDSLIARDSTIAFLLEAGARALFA